jgi:NAD(P)-dependent dehydrogenase (short-subunit alcohol dehydrogenase family)
MHHRCRRYAEFALVVVFLGVYLTKLVSTPQPLKHAELAAPHLPAHYTRLPWWSEEEPPSDEHDLSDRVAIIVGGSSGIGRAVVQDLVGRRCTVILTSRSLRRAEKAAKAFDSALVTPMALDLADLNDVRRFAKAFLELNPAKLNYLVLNAGMGALLGGSTFGWDGPWASPQGYEILYAANYLGHFLLLQLMLPSLRASSPARVTATSSIAHWWHDTDAVAGGGLLPARQRTTHEDHSGAAKFRQYGNTKLAQILMCLEAQRRFGGDAGGPGGITFTPLAPGLIATAIANPQLDSRDGSDGFMPGALPPKQGAMTTLHALLSDSGSGGGAFLQPYSSPMHESPPPLGGWTVMLVYEAVLQRRHWGLHRWKPHPDAFNATFASALWDASAEAVGTVAGPAQPPATTHQCHQPPDEAVQSVDAADGEL